MHFTIVIYQKTLEGVKVVESIHFFTETTYNKAKIKVSTAKKAN